MVEPGSEFEDSHDEEPQGPLLPPEDRLWRHPSELSTASTPSPEQTLIARRRWMASTPSRAGAGAAGVVGAILAAGVVLIGTHLTTWLTATHSSPATGSSQSILAAVQTTSTTVAEPVSVVGLTAVLNAVSGSLVKIKAIRSSGVAAGDGVVVSPKGYIVAPAGLVSDASSISVIRADGEELVATLTGTDPSTGLAVLRVDERGLPALRFAKLSAPPNGSLVLIGVWRGRAASIKLAQSGGPEQNAEIGRGPAVLVRCPASLGLSRAPKGAVVVNGKGAIVAFVTAHRDHAALAATGWLAGHVTEDLISTGQVDHGWLGIVGTSTRFDSSTMGPEKHLGPGVTPPQHRRLGVKVVAVQSDSAAAKAGLRAGDVIADVNGRAVSSMAGLEADLYLMKPASTVKLSVVRGDHLSTVNARLQPAA